MENATARILLEELRQRLEELIRTLATASREVAGLLQEGAVARGLNGLQEVLEAFQHFHRGLDFLLLADGKSYMFLAALKEKLEARYPLLYEALEAGDTVTLADVLSYEIAETLEDYCCPGKVN
ncbi:MAG TPA: hypothetical protein EYP63_07535 [Desulfotomaculum sp.]|nr:hypothetical protein [Desulfotomaculum sp.]